MKYIRLNEITPLIRGVFRSYPLMFTIISLIIAVVFKLNTLLFLIILILVSSLFNKFVSKNVLFKLFEVLNLKHIAARPEGCKNSRRMLVRVQSKRRPNRRPGRRQNAIPKSIKREERGFLIFKQS